MHQFHDDLLCDIATTTRNVLRTGDADTAFIGQATGPVKAPWYRALF
jgi:hypothetical protein